MLFTVSTVKDTLPHLQRFVVGNLAGGADHLVVFVDDPDGTDPDALDFLEAHAGVTCVRADDTWWAGDRPAQLNVRQRINANVAKAALAWLDPGHHWAEWVFHIDADEVVQVDRAALAQAPVDLEAVRLAPLEAVAQRRWDDDPTLFKRLLDADDLTLLHTLGVIDRPHNGAYFHGHVDGKSGVRPTLDLWLALHQVLDADKAEVTAWQHERLRVLHYESFSGEDFVRKWTGLLEAGPSIKFRKGREPTAVALRALLGKGLTPEQARPYLMRIFERTTEDDLTTLRDLGLLEEVDPRLGSHVPADFPDGARDALAGLLEALRPAPKRDFHPGRPAAAVRRLLENLQPGGASGPVTGGARRFLRRS